MATGAAAAAPTIQGTPYAEKITLAPVGSFADTTAKLLIGSIGITNPIPSNTLKGHGQGIYTDITA